MWFVWYRRYQLSGPLDPDAFCPDRDYQTAQESLNWMATHPAMMNGHASVVCTRPSTRQKTSLSITMIQRIHSLNTESVIFATMDTCGRDLLYLLVSLYRLTNL